MSTDYTLTPGLTTGREVVLTTRCPRVESLASIMARRSLGSRFWISACAARKLTLIHAAGFYGSHPDSPYSARFIAPDGRHMRLSEAVKYAAGREITLDITPALRDNA
jgi:hypothetical protein